MPRNTNSNGDTPFVENLKAQLAAQNLSDATIHQYLASVRRINGGEPIKSLQFLYDTEKVGKFLDAQKLYNRRNYVTAAVKVLSLINNKQAPKYLKYYRDYQDALNKQALGTGFSEKKQANMVDFGDVESRFNGLYDKMKIYTKPMLMASPSKFRKYMSTLALGLWCLDAPTRSSDLLNMFIVKSDIPKDRNVDVNFIIVDKGLLYMNQYKTVAAYGPKTFNLDDKSVDFFKTMMKIHPFSDDYDRGEAVRLIVNNNLQPILASNTFTKMINDIFKDTGKKVSTNIIRSSYLTHKYGKVNEEMKEDADRMMHSVETQKGYIEPEASST